MNTNRLNHAVQSAAACLTAILLQPSKTRVMKRFATLALLFAMLAAGNGLAATYTWDGGNASGNWSQAGAGGNWTGGAAPASSTANALVFQSNSNGQIANNDIGTSFDVDTLAFNVSGITLSGGSIRFNTATATKMTFGANAVTFNNSLELAVDTTLSTSTANPIIFNGQLVGPGKLTYVNAGTSVGTLFKFASSTTNTINGFTLGNATSGKGKATVQIAMDNPFGGANTTAFLNNSGGVTFIPMGANRVVASGLSYRDNITFSGSFDLTFQGNGAYNTSGTIRSIYNNLDSGKILTLGTSSSTWNLQQAIFDGSGMGVLAAVVNDTATVGFNKSGTGTWRLTGASTYITQTKVNAGTLEFNSVENKGSTTASALGKPTVDGIREIIALGNTTTAVTLKYVGTTGGGHSTDRPLNLTGTSGGATVDASGTGPISFLGGVYATGLGNKTLILQGANTGDNTIGGVISNSAGYATSLMKDGVGTWRLTGDSTYTGATTVKGGKLLVNGSLDAGTSVTVTNAILGGTGTLNGNLTVRNNGIVAPGTSVGTLTNNLSGSKAAVFATGAKFMFELGAPGTSDAIAFTGLTGNQVTFNNNVIDFSNAGSWGAGTYTLFTFDADNAYTGTLVIGTGLGLFDPATHFIYNANSIQLVVVAAVTQPTVTIAKTMDGAEEGPVNATFTVTRDNVGIANQATVHYAVTGTAASGSDYTALSGSVAIEANQTSATITVPVLQDNNFAEGTETVIITLSSDAAYTVGVPASATADIVDGNKPVVSIVKTTDGAEAGPVNGVFTVSRTAGETTNYALTVNYTVDVSSTATNGSDYTALSGSVTIGVGNTTATIAVPVLQDSDFGEGSETVILNLSEDSAYIVETPSSATLNITDGVKPIVTLLKTTNGAEAGPVNGTFTVYRSTDNGTANPLTVYYTTNGSSATAGSDYTALSDNVIILAGQTNAIITVPVLQDINFAEGTETVVLNLSANAIYTVGTPGSATMDITDGIQPVVNIVKTTDGSEVGPVNGSFTISRSPESASSGPVTVYFTTNGSAATAVSDYTALGTTNVFMSLGETNATIHVNVIRDSLTEGPEGVQLNLIPNSGYTIGDSGSAIVSIEDDIPPVVGERHDFTALYTFSNSVYGSVTDPTPPPYEKGIYFGSFSMFGGAKIGFNGVAGQFYATDWDISDTNQVVNRYFEVTLTPVAKVEMTLTNITFDVARQKDQGTIPVGPARWAIRSSLDNFMTNMAVMSISPANSSLSIVATETVLINATPATGVMQSGSRLTLDIGYASITNALTLRIYGWENAGDKDGGIDNFAISGSWKIPPLRGTMVTFQ